MDRTEPDEVLPECDFSRGLPNKFASRYAAGSAVVVLEPDVVQPLPTASEVIEAPVSRRAI